MTNSSLPRILIVDDEKPLMSALCRTLKEQGCDTTGFSSGVQALEALHERDFDLLLSDLMMPEMNGIDLLKAALKVRPDLVAIIMTGEGTIATAVEAMKNGALDYILKPFKLSAILPVLERALAVRRLRQQNAALQLEVQQRTSQLELANKELEAFSYSVSHDLRTPLRHIAGFADIVSKTESALSDKGHRHIGQISQAAERMGQLIDDLLDFSRMGRVDMNQRPVDLEGLRDEVIGSLAPETEKREIAWIKGELPRVQGDLALLRQVFQNLFSNAVKYTAPRPRAEIEIACCGQSPEEITFFVRDNGVGFDMRFAEKLFGVFQRMHSSEEFEGTGVGLANVRRIITRHGGRTWAEAKVDEGAVFYFTLPPATTNGC
jgi:two-component system sensor histidine kinase/response regulator